MSGLGGESEERLMCHSIMHCAQIGGGCLCSENPIAPKMWGKPPPGWIDDRETTGYAALGDDDGNR